jgi:hypothetical protein
MDPTPRTYFAAATAKDIGERLIQKIERNDENEFVSQIRNRLHDAWRYYYGYDPSGLHATSGISRGGSQGELAEVRINHSRALVNTLVNLIVAPKIVWTPKATNIDYDSVKQLEVASSVLEYYWHERFISQYAVRAVEEAVAFTEGFILKEWDPEAGEPLSVDPETIGTPNPRIIKTGDLRFTNISTWNVIRDSNKSSWAELDWVIVRVYRNKWDLAARYPQCREDILSVSEDVTLNSPVYPVKIDQTDDIPVYLFFHKRTPVLPVGREVILLQNKKVLKDGPLSYDDIPLYRVAPAELIGTPYGYSPYLEIMGIQELIDSLSSSAATNLTTFGTQNIILPHGTEWSVDQLAGGMRAFYCDPNGNKPEALQLAKTPNELYQYIETLKKDQELLFGLNSVVRGQADSDKFSGSALALLQSQAQQQSSNLSGNYLRMVQSLGQGVIDTFKRRASAPRKIALVGKQNSFLIQEEEFSQKTFERIKSVTVDIGNPLSQTPAGRVEMAKELMQMGLVTTPEQYEQVLTTGKVDPLTNGLKNELINILSENQDISNGVTPAAMLHDNHMLHGREHRSPVASALARKNPSTLKAHGDHLNQHYALQYNIIPPVPTNHPQYQDALNQAVMMDPLYHTRMLTLMGMPPPIDPMMMAGAGAPPPPGGDPNAPAPPGMEPTGNGAPEMPRNPTQPLTGMEWNPTDGGGAVAPPTT